MQHNFIEIARKVLNQEKLILEKLSSLISEPFVQAIDLISSTQGKVICSGVGKSGQVGEKIAATLCSLGTPAIFINPLNGAHGDLGVTQKGDVFLLFSKSGESEEILQFIDYGLKNSISTIGVTAKVESSLWKKSTVKLQIPDMPEACSLGLAPTSSVIAMIGLGDSLAVALSQKKKINETFYRSHHPGGVLGKSLETLGALSQKISQDLLVLSSQNLEEAFKAINIRRKKIVFIQNEHQYVIGYLSPEQFLSDLFQKDSSQEHSTHKKASSWKNFFDQYSLENIKSKALSWILKHQSPQAFLAFSSDTLVREAGEIMKKNQISWAMVLDKNHDLIKNGLQTLNHMHFFDQNLSLKINHISGIFFHEG